MDQFVIQLTVSQLRDIVREELESCLGAIEHEKQTSGNASEEILNVKQVAECFNFAISTIYKMVSKRKIPFCKRGKRLYFIKAELIEWIKEGRKPAIELEAEAYIEGLKLRREKLGKV
jgi:excisionase family DNA binding protein